MADHHQPLSPFVTTTISSPIVGSLERILASSSTQDGDDLVYSQSELTTGLWTTRVGGIITLVSSLFMIWRAWNRREGLFNRLILGMGIHLTIFGIANTIGASAIPHDTTNAMANIGSTATCTTQGFLIYVTFLTACSYYGSFSLYSFVGTLNNFENVWLVEKFIHVIVHIYPICSGIYLITQEIFNNSGFGYCFLEVDPIGCGSESDNIFSDDQNYVPCERGPDSQQKARLLQLFWIVYLYIAMFVPTAIMIALYFQVRYDQENVQIPAQEVAKQAFVYLLVLYAGILPSALVDSLEWSQSLSIGANLFSDIMFMLFGLLSMLTYLYFTTGDWLAPIDSDDDECDCDEEEGEDSLPDVSTDFIFGHLQQALKREGEGTGAIVEGPAAKNNNSPQRKSKHNNGSGSLSLPKSSKSFRNMSGRGRSTSKGRASSRFSFNIFDGTNAAGQYADFIFEGDSADLRYDKAETEMWDAVQNHI